MNPGKLKEWTKGRKIKVKMREVVELSIEISHKLVISEKMVTLTSTKLTFDLDLWKPLPLGLPLGLNR